MKLSLLFFTIPVMICVIFAYQMTGSFLQTHDLGDFRAQYTGARIVSEGKMRYLYDEKTQLDVQKPLIRNYTRGRAVLYISPPVLALIMAPLGWLPPATSFFIFVLAMMSLLVGTMVLIIKNVRISHKISGVFPAVSPWSALFIASGFFFLWTGTLQGQLSVLWLFIVTVVWSLYIRKHGVGAGLMLSLLFLKPHLIIVPALYFLVLRKWRVLQGLAIGIVVISILSVYMVGIDGIRQYIGYLAQARTTERVHGMFSSYQTSLHGFISFIGLVLSGNAKDKLPGYVLPLWIVMSAVIIVFSIRFWRRLSLKSAAYYDVSYTHMLIVMLFTSAHTHNYDLSILFLPLALMSARSVRSNEKKILKYGKISVNYGVLVFFLCVFFSTMFINLFNRLSILAYVLIFYYYYSQYARDHLERKS